MSIKIYPAIITAISISSGFNSAVYAQEAAAQEDQTILTFSHLEESFSGLGSSYTPRSDLGISYTHGKFQMDLLLDLGANEFPGFEKGESGLERLSLTYGTDAGRNILTDNWTFTFGLLGDVRVMEGALDGWYNGVTPLGANLAFEGERLTDFIGLEIRKKTPFAQNWSWNSYTTIGRSYRNAEALTPRDLFGFIDRHNVNVAPVVRGELYDFWDDAYQEINPAIIGYYPDLDGEVRDTIAGIPDEDLQNFYERLVDFALPYIERKYPTVSGEEFVGGVAALAGVDDVEDIRADILYDLVSTVRRGQGDSDKLSYIFKSELERKTDTGCFKAGVEGSLVEPGKIGSAVEQSVALFMKACKHINPNLTWSFLGEVAGFRNYMNLEGLETASGVAFTSLEWQPSAIPDLTVSYGLGRSISALIGDTTHQQLGVSYNFVDNKKWNVSASGFISEMDVDDGLFEGSHRGSQIAFTVQRKLGRYNH